MALKTFEKEISLGSTSGTYGSEGHLKLRVVENSTNIGTNKSNCTATLTFKVDQYNWRASSASWGLSGYKSANGSLVSMQYYSGTTTLWSKTFDVEHDSDGKKTINFSFNFSSTNVFGGSGSLSCVLTEIPRKANILTAQDFTDEANPTFTYENKASASVTSLQAGIYSLDDTAYADYRDVEIDETSYTFELTNEERDALRSAIPNDNELQIKYVLKTVIGGNTYYSELQKKMTLIDANPTFSNFVFEDTNTTTLALTGNNQYCVLGYSNIKATVSTSNKATPNKGASMSKYRLSIDTASVDIAYSISADVNGTINNASSETYLMYAIDSRNNATSVTKLASVVKEYQNVYINRQTSKIERNNNGTGTSAQLTLNGTFWNASFGSVTNTIKSITYQYKKTTSSTWLTGTTSITASASGNNYTFTGYIAGDDTGGTWDASDSYNVKIFVSDELSTDTIDLILNSGTPTLALAKTGVAINGIYDEQLGGGCQVNNGLYVDGEDIPLGLQTVTDNVNVLTTKVNNMYTYSTSETVIGTWMDKPLYRKVVEYTNSSTIGQTGQSTTISIAHNISNLGIVWLEKGFTSDGRDIPFFNGTTSLTNGVCVPAINGTNIQLRIVNNSWGTRTWYFILHYTKTTD